MYLMWKCRDCVEEFHILCVKGIPKEDTACPNCGSESTDPVTEQWPADHGQFGVGA